MIVSKPSKKLRLPQFSLRCILIGFGVFACVFYLLFVRPTVIANRFVSLIKHGDYSSAFELCTSSSAVDWGADPPKYEAWLESRELNDLLFARRRLGLRVTPGPLNQPNQIVELHHQYTATAKPFTMYLDLDNDLQFFTSRDSDTKPSE